MRSFASGGARGLGRPGGAGDDGSSVRFDARGSAEVGRVTPFLELRMWLRRGPRAERVLAGLAVAVLAPLLIWAATPPDRDQAGVTTGASGAGAVSGTVAAGTGGPAAATGGAAGGGTGTGAGSSVTTAAPAGAASGGGPAVTAAGQAATGNRCANLRATDQGVSPTEIFVAVPVLNLGGAVGNETVGVRGNVEEVVNAVADAINDEGGVACRKLRVKVYKVNPIDQNEQRARCLEIVNDKPFAAVDISGFADPASRSCILRAKIPFQGTTPVDESETVQNAPYLYSLLPSADRAARNWSIEAVERGTFDPAKGFKKLGILLTECNPGANTQLLDNLTQRGISRQQMSIFTLSGCGGIASPSEISQAVLAHRNAGATHVFLAGTALNSQNYVRSADGVQFKPVYLASDFGQETNPTLAKMWSDGFDGAVGITSFRLGERNIGIEHPEVTRCNKWLKDRGVAPSSGESDQAPLNVCDEFRLFVAAANAAGPGLTRSILLGGLAKVGRFEGGLVGVGIFDRPGKVTGGDYIRASQWHRDCTCWRALDREMKPGH
jgi:hypothetical protein